MISQQGTLAMTEELGTKIHKYFDVMYRNRLSRIKNREKSKGKENECGEEKNKGKERK